MSVFSALLNNGPLLVGPLADRGAFDQYASYRPGQIVVDDGVVYLNIAALGAAPELEDIFDRRDQQGWGQSSHGEVWQTADNWSHHQERGIIAAARGVLGNDPEAQSDGQLLGAATVRTACEMLTRLALTLPAGEDTLALSALLNATEDGSSAALLRVTVQPDGTSSLVTNIQTPDFVDGDGDSAAGPVFAAGQDVWLRLRRVGLVYTAAVWPVGSAEAAPQVTQTASHAQPAGHPGFYIDDAAAGTSVSVAYLSLRHVTAATVPSDDTEHWVALSDALQVPQPL